MVFVFVFVLVLVLVEVSGLWFLSRIRGCFPGAGLSV